MKPTIKQPLFVITGASGVGKSSLCEELFLHEKDYIVMEGDLLWNPVYDTPEDHYSAYRRQWMKLCAHISQIGKPVVWCGCALPEQFENQPERELFTEIHYLAVVCEDEVLEDRMRAGRGIEDDGWIKSSSDFNSWLRENAALTSPPITLLDNSRLTARRTAALADQWIRRLMANP